MKKVAVVGSGEVGEALSNGFLAHGYAVMRGSRDPAKLAAWQERLEPRVQDVVAGLTYALGAGSGASVAGGGMTILSSWRSPITR